MKMKKIIIITFLLILTITFIESFLVLISGKGLFSVASRQKYEYTDEYSTLLSVISSSDPDGYLQIDKNIRLLSKYTISSNTVVNVYAHKPNNNVLVVAFPDTRDDKTEENVIVAVALKKEFIDTYNEKKEDIIYPLMRKEDWNRKYMTVKSPFLILPGDIYKDGKIISVYTNKDRMNLIKSLKKE